MKPQFKTFTQMPVGQCFVLVPGLRGRYLRTHISVAFVACSHPNCRATVHEPCKGSDGNYHGDTHVLRREAYQKFLKLQRGEVEDEAAQQESTELSQET